MNLKQTINGIKKHSKKIIINELFYRIRMFFCKIVFFGFIKKGTTIEIQSPQETVKIIKSIINKKETGSYIRFGDGDINIVTKRLIGCRHQKYDPKLQQELIESLQINSQNTIKGVMIHSQKYGISNGMKPGFHQLSDVVAEEILINTFSYFIGEKLYSPVAIHYLSIEDKKEIIDLFKIIKKNRIIYVSNKETEEISKEILGNKIDFIGTESINNYKNIDDTEQEIEKSLKKTDNDFTIILLSCGVTSRVLIKRLLKKYIKTKKKIFFLDLGSFIEGFRKNTRRSRVKKVDKEYWNTLKEELKNI